MDFHYSQQLCSVESLWTWISEYWTFAPRRSTRLGSYKLLVTFCQQTNTWPCCICVFKTLYLIYVADALTLNSSEECRNLTPEWSLSSTDILSAKYITAFLLRNNRWHFRTTFRWDFKEWNLQLRNPTKMQKTPHHTTHDTKQIRNMTTVYSMRAEIRRWYCFIPSTQAGNVCTTLLMLANVYKCATSTSCGL